MIPEIRYDDQLTDRGMFELTDPESAAELRQLAAGWARANTSPLRPALRRAWRAMAACKAGGFRLTSTVRVYPACPRPWAHGVGLSEPAAPPHAPFPLVRVLRPAYGAWQPTHAVGLA